MISVILLLLLVFDVFDFFIIQFDQKHKKVSSACYVSTGTREIVEIRIQTVNIKNIRNTEIYTHNKDNRHNTEKQSVTRTQLKTGSMGQVDR